MASHVRVAIQDENLNVHKGKATTVGKSDALNVQKGFKVRKALVDLSKRGKNTNAGSPKVSVLKQKPVTSTKNNKSARQNFQLSEEEIKKCNEWAREGIEHIHFSGTDMHNFEKEKAEREMDNEVNMITSSVHNWACMACLSCLTPMEVGNKHDKDLMQFELEPELPWSPREQMDDDNLSLFGDSEEPFDSFLDDEQYCIREFKLKMEYEDEAT